MARLLSFFGWIAARYTNSRIDDEVVDADRAAELRAMAAREIEFLDFDRALNRQEHMHRGEIDAWNCDEGGDE